MRSILRHALLAALLAIPATQVAAQAVNPTLRPATPHVRVAAQTRFNFGILEFAVTGASPFADSCGDHNGTVYSGAEVEPHVTVNPLNPDHLLGAWQQDRYSNGGSRGQVAGVSFNGGFTWTRSALPVSLCAGGLFERATDPWVAFAPDGTAHQVALAFSGEENTPSSVSAIVAARSTDGGLTWSAPVVVASDTGIFFNDKETITADPRDARFVYAIWDRLDFTGAPTRFARSTDGGVTWEPARTIYTPSDGSQTGQTIGNVIRVLPNGTLVNAFMQFLPGKGGVHVMHSTDRGETWSAPTLVSSAPSVGTRDPDTGNPVRDGAILPQMAVAPDGILYMVWQDFRFSQVRDAIAFSRSPDGGHTWSAPVRVNSDPNVAAFTPQVHVRADGTIGVTYYDLRSNTADPATLLADYWIARSTDGVNWSETRISQPFDVSKAPLTGSGYFLGDYTGLTSSGATFIALYGKTTGDLANRNDIYVARIGAGQALRDAKSVLAEEAALATYAAAPLPDWEIAPALQEAAQAAALRALASRYLKVQR